jgi:hypothetical protein
MAWKNAVAEVDAADSSSTSLVSLLLSIPIEAQNGVTLSPPTIFTFESSAPTRSLALPGATAIPNRRRLLCNRPQAHQYTAVLCVFAMLLSIGWIAWTQSTQFFHTTDDLTGDAAITAVVERIIKVESNGDANTRNGRTTATGVAQFIDETWLDLIHMYRPDLTRIYSEKDILALRKETALAREMTTRLVELNAKMLRRRGLPVTAGTVYLAHFADSAGAAAVLSATDNQDAAFILAAADARGRTKREQIVRANPFIEHFTVADLKAWADAKMYERRFNVAQTSTTNEYRK